VLHKEGCVILNPINGGTTSTTTELYKYYFDSILIVTLITIIADKDNLRVLVTSEANENTHVKDIPLPSHVPPYTRTEYQN
jgi:hypothetical protein